MIAGVFTPPRMAPEFTVSGSTGRELNLSDYRGKVVVLGFGFTNCADVCPITLAVLAQARKKLGALAEQLQVIYLTVDPERDDVARLNTYLEHFDPSFLGGTGEPETLADIRQAYGILASKQTVASGYTVAHSSYTYLIDRDGKLRALMPFGHSADDYAHDIDMLLAQQSSTSP